MDTHRRSRRYARTDLPVALAIVGAFLIGCQPGDFEYRVTGSGTLFGSTVERRPGENYQSATSRTINEFGALPIVRYFTSGPPDSWPTIRDNVGARPIVVSFKMAPADVVAGTYDAEVSRWFRMAPSDAPTYWSFHPEPEDDIADGSYTAAEFRAAWSHLAAVARETGNAELRATLILMCYSLTNASGRDWHDYYPRESDVDVLAWDCYNHAAEDGRYESPTRLFGAAISLNRRLEKPFAVAEFASTLIPGDDGTRRASWLVDTAEYLSRHHAVFVTYFDSAVGGAYRLEDDPSIAAWRAAMSR